MLSLTAGSLNYVCLFFFIQEPVRIEGPVKLQKSSMTFNLSKPGVLLLHICDKPTSPPGQVSIDSQLPPLQGFPKIILNVLK